MNRTLPFRAKAAFAAAATLALTSLIPQASQAATPTPSGGGFTVPVEYHKLDNGLRVEMHR